MKIYNSIMQNKQSVFTILLWMFVNRYGIFLMKKIFVFGLMAALGRKNRSEFLYFFRILKFYDWILRNIADFISFVMNLHRFDVEISTEFHSNFILLKIENSTTNPSTFFISNFWLLHSCIWKSTLQHFVF